MAGLAWRRPVGQGDQPLEAGPVAGHARPELVAARSRLGEVLGTAQGPAEEGHVAVQGLGAGLAALVVEGPEVSP